MIGTLSLVLSLIFAGTETWPYGRFREVAISTILLGVGYTVFSEWHNTTVTYSWAYTSAMPTFFGIGLAPIAQWIVIPSFSLWVDTSTITYRVISYFNRFVPSNRKY